MKLRLVDGVRLGLCVAGQRRFCTAHKIDFREYAKNGIDVADLEGIEDANLQRAIRSLKDREAEGGR